MMDLTWTSLPVLVAAIITAFRAGIIRGRRQAYIGTLDFVANVAGSGNAVIQRGNVVGGDLVGGDLIVSPQKGEARCKHCGALH